MNLISTFANNQRMPDRYTCKETKQGGFSPELQWNEVPNGTESFALICEDPDAVGGTFVHWVLHNIPAEMRDLPENAFIEKIEGVQEGCNTTNELGWFHACPPASTGTHRYIFTLYALDTPLDLAESVTADALKKAMEGHIVSTAELIGLYSID